MSSSTLKATSRTSKTSGVSCGSSDIKYLGKGISGIDGNIVMKMLKCIQDNKKKQDYKLESRRNDNEYDDENDDLDLVPPVKEARSYTNYNDVQNTLTDSEQSVEKSRFAAMSKRLKQKE